MNIWWSKDPFSFPWLPASVTFSLIKHNFNIIYNKRGINQYKEPIYILKAVNSKKSLRHVAMVAQCLDNKKQKSSLKKWICTFSNFATLMLCVWMYVKYRHFSFKIVNDYFTLSQEAWSNKQQEQLQHLGTAIFHLLVDILLSLTDIALFYSNSIQNAKGRLFKRSLANA